MKSRKKTQIDELEKLNREAVPVVEYQNAKRRRRNNSIASTILVIIIECVIACGLFSVIFEYNFAERVRREFLIRNNGELSLTTGTYTGETDFGYFLGEGTFQYKSGSKVEGKWNNNQLNGFATYDSLAEGTYTGDFVDSKRNGSGVFSWEDGAKYVGEWKDDKINGLGTYTSPLGVKYEGTFVDNALNSGTVSFVNTTGDYAFTVDNGNVSQLEINYKDGSHYIGEGTYSELEGTGTLAYENGDCYTGEFSEGMREGTGTYQWATGDFYEGDWVDDKMSGTGKYTHNVEGQVYYNYVAEGTFNNNKFTDGSYSITTETGEYTFSIENSKAVYITMALDGGNTTYSGDITDGELTGDANIEYSNGDSYSGKVVNGVKSGTGKYTWKSGAYYTGAWESDFMHGQGNYYYGSGTGYKLAGKFVNGRPEGSCNYYATSSEFYNPFSEKCP